MVRGELPNGMRVIVKRNRLSPAVAVRLCLHTGSVHDPAGREGLALTTSALLEEGTRKRTGAEISEMIDFLGAETGASVDKHSTLLLGSMMRGDLDAILKLFVEMLIEPVFPARDLEKVKGQLIGDLREDENDTRSVAMKALQTILYGRRHPYGRPGGGTVRSIRCLARRDLVAFHNGRYYPRGAILVIVGDVNEREALRKATSVFRRWKGDGPAEPPDVPDAAPMKKTVVRVKAMADKTQNDLALGFVGIRRLDPDFHAAVVLNQVLGAFGLGGRLGGRIREEEGLAYYVYSAIRPSVGPGPFVIRAGIHPDHVGRAVRLVLEEIDRIRERRVSRRELDETKRYLIDSLPLRLETNEGIAAFLLNEEYYGLGPGYLTRYREELTSVTAADLLRVAGRLLSAERFALSVAGPPLPAPVEESIASLSV